MADRDVAKNKTLKHWALFCVRWGIAVVGVWIVVAHMSVRDQALVILNTETNLPVQVSLESRVDESAAVFPAIDPGTGKIFAVPRDRVVNKPDPDKAQLVGLGGVLKTVAVVGLDLPPRLAHDSQPSRLLIVDGKGGPARWAAAAEVLNYRVKVPYPRDQVGLASMIHGANPLLLLAAVFVFPLTILITSYRWHELLKALDIHIGKGRTFVLNMVGSFYNSFMPGSTGGDMLKAYYASKQTPHRMRAVMSVVVDRVIGLLALIILGGIMAGFQWQIPACRKVAIGAATICTCVLIGLLVFYNPALHRLSGLDWFLKKLPLQRQVQSAVSTMRLYGLHPWLAVWALLISLPVHGAVVSSAMFAGMAFGLPLHWAYYWVAVPVIVLAGAVPISPQGAGVMEAFAVLLTRQQGVTVSQAFALTMSIRVVQILWNLTGGVFVLRGGFHAPTVTEQHELEDDRSDNGETGPAMAMAG